jgi:hypothetical protein
MEAWARPLIYANMAGIWVYIVLWQGAQRFFIESFATWVISPIIYTRICPDSFRAPLIRALVQEPLLSDLLCAVPVVMFVASLGFGFFAFRRRSFPLAVVACFLMSTIFVVYHSLKHLGMRLEYI